MIVASVLVKFSYGICSPVTISVIDTVLCSLKSAPLMTISVVSVLIGLPSMLVILIISGTGGGTVSCELKFT